jgi:hypothetical protein
MKMSLLSGASGTLSATADFFPKPPARFPQLRISSRSLRHVFRNRGFLPGASDTFSATADFFSELPARFPQLRILSSFLILMK